MIGITSPSPGVHVLSHLPTAWPESILVYLNSVDVRRTEELNKELSSILGIYRREDDQSGFVRIDDEEIGCPIWVKRETDAVMPDNYMYIYFGEWGWSIGSSISGDSPFVYEPSMNKDGVPLTGWRRHDSYIYSGFDSGCPIRVERMDNRKLAPTGCFNHLESWLSEEVNYLKSDGIKDAWKEELKLLKGRQIVIHFVPGHIGILGEKDTVIKIGEGSQAELAGVKVGWKIMGIGHHKCTDFGDKLLKDAQNGGTSYQVTFDMQELQPENSDKLPKDGYVEILAADRITKFLPAGSSVLEVVDKSKFHLRQKIVLDRGTWKEEELSIIGLRPFCVSPATKYNHFVGATVEACNIHPQGEESLSPLLEMKEWAKTQGECCFDCLLTVLHGMRRLVEDPAKKAPEKTPAATKELVIDSAPVEDIVMLPPKKVATPPASPKMEEMKEKKTQSLPADLGRCTPVVTPIWPSGKRDDHLAEVRDGFKRMEDEFALLVTSLEAQGNDERERKEAETREIRLLKDQLEQAKASAVENASLAAREARSAVELENELIAVRKESSDLIRTMEDAQQNKLDDVVMQLTLTTEKQTGALHALQVKQVQCEEFERAFKAETARCSELQCALQLEQAKSSELVRSKKLEESRCVGLQGTLQSEQERCSDMQRSRELEVRRCSDLQEALQAEILKNSELQRLKDLEEIKRVDLQGALQAEQIRCNDMHRSRELEQVRSGELEEALQTEQAISSDLQKSKERERTRISELEITLQSEQAVLNELQARTAELQDALQIEKGRCADLEGTLQVEQARCLELGTTRCAELQDALQIEQARCADLEDAFLAEQERCRELQQSQLEQAGHLQLQNELQVAQTNFNELQTVVRSGQEHIAELQDALRYEQDRRKEFESALAQEQVRCVELETAFQTEQLRTSNLEALQGNQALNAATEHKRSAELEARCQELMAQLEATTGTDNRFAADVETLRIRCAKAEGQVKIEENARLAEADKFIGEVNKLTAEMNELRENAKKATKEGTPNRQRPVATRSPSAISQASGSTPVKLRVTEEVVQERIGSQPKRSAILVESDVVADLAAQIRTTQDRAQPNKVTPAPKIRVVQASPKTLQRSCGNAPMLTPASSAPSVKFRPVLAKAM